MRDQIYSFRSTSFLRAMIERETDLKEFVENEKFKAMIQNFNEYEIDEEKKKLLREQMISLYLEDEAVLNL